jgi:hypothetical protein
MDSNLYGAFPVKRLFWVVLTVFCSERERPFFVPSPEVRFARDSCWREMDSNFRFRAG